MNKATRFLSVIILVASIGGRAASAQVAPPQQRRQSNVKSTTSNTIQRAVSFREVAGRGLLFRTWVNGIGPFNFAIDTGAGATLISSRVAAESHVARATDRPTSISGLMGARTTAYHASPENLAIGDIENYLPAKGEVLITSSLPADLDGVLDPTEALAPLGYTIDIPRREFIAFDPRSEAVEVNRPPLEGAVVTWLREAHGRRPFVMLDNGDRALIDTGSPGTGDTRSQRSIGRSRGGGRRERNDFTRRVSTLDNRDCCSRSEESQPTWFRGRGRCARPPGIDCAQTFSYRFDPSIG